MKRITMIRVLALLMTLLMALPLVACGDSGAGKDTTAAPTDTTAPTETQPGAETADPTVDANGFKLDTLDPTLDFGGETFTTLYWEDREHEEFFVEEMTGENVNDALYTRNEAVQKRMNVKLDWIGTKGNGDLVNVANYVSVVRKSNDAGDQAYDMLAAYSLSTAACAQNGLTMDLLELDHLNFDMPWWPSKLIEQATIHDKLYFASGDISANVIYMMYGCFFNKNLLEDYELESPYDLVLNDQWTNAKMFEMATGIYEDLNGDGVKNIGDQFGFYATNLHADAFLWGSGTTVIINDGENGLILNPAYSSERTQSVLEQFCTFMYETNDGIFTAGNDTGPFSTNQVLFYYDRVRLATRTEIRDNEDLDFGIVPIPKFDDSQETYSCIMGNPHTLYAIPLKQDNAEMSAAVMECMASESYRQVTPELFGITLQIKYAKDEVTSQMLEIIRDNVVFDLGRLFYASIDGLTTLAWQDSVRNNNPNWISTLKRQMRVIDTRIKKLNESFE